MCGIVGVTSKKGDNVVPLIEEMLTSIAFRGPDGPQFSYMSNNIFGTLMDIGVEVVTKSQHRY